MKEEDVRRLVMEERRLYREMEGLTREILVLERSMNEINNALNTLREMQQESLSKRETLFPIGGGAFIFGFPTEEDRVLISVGANVFIVKTKEEAIKHLTEALNSLNKTHLDRLRALNELKKKHEEITARILEYQVSEKQRNV